MMILNKSTGRLAQWKREQGVILRQRAINGRLSLVEEVQRRVIITDIGMTVPFFLQNA